jgi:hypothetical protein
MNINLDDDIRHARVRTSANSISVPLSQLFFIIVFGVFIANMLSWGAQRGIDFMVAQQLLKKASEELAIQQKLNDARMKEQRKINAKIVLQRQLENQKKQAGYRQAIETCNFWRDQYRKSQTSSDKYQLDRSCDFVNQFR